MKCVAPPGEIAPSPAELRGQIEPWAGPIMAEFHEFVHGDSGGSDVAVATAWWTAYELPHIDAFPIYFVQDLENLFNPAGDFSVRAEASYQLGIPAITIGSWLKEQLEARGSLAKSTRFGVDTSVYQAWNTERGNLVVVLDQPEKSRRCHTLLRESITILRNLAPELSVVTYGSEINMGFPSHHHLGLVPEQRLAQLYSSAKCGVITSSTNPSRIPFEMNACGLPVIDLDVPSTSLDYEGFCIERELPIPQMIAEKIISVARSREHESTALEVAESIRKDFRVIDELEDFEKALLNLLEGPRPKLREPRGELVFTQPHTPRASRILKTAKELAPKAIQRLRNA